MTAIVTPPLRYQEIVVLHEMDSRLIEKIFVISSVFIRIYNNQSRRVYLPSYVCVYVCVSNFLDKYSLFSRVWFEPTSRSYNLLHNRIVLLQKSRHV